MKVLVTGPFGNVGGHLLPALLRDGHQVRGFARDSRAHRAAARRQGSRLELAWGDLRDAGSLAPAVAGMEVVIHLAAVIPPWSDEDPRYAHAVNVDGTRNLLEACAALPRPPRLLFASSFTVHGHTLRRPPPRVATDPLVATDPYTEQKIAAEALVRSSGLEWSIFRLSDVPILGPRRPHPIMFEIGLDNRIESLHADDAAVAVARALRTPAVWGRTLLVGGGPSCQLTYRDYLARLLDAMGIGALPEEAFGTAEYATDWIDSGEAQALLGYQRRSFDDIAADVAAGLGWRRRLVPVAAPLIRRVLLARSPYWKARG